MRRAKLTRTAGIHSPLQRKAQLVQYPVVDRLSSHPKEVVKISIDLYTCIADCIRGGYMFFLLYTYMATTRSDD